MAWVTLDPAHRGFDFLALPFEHLHEVSALIERHPRDAVALVVPPRHPEEFH